MIDAQMDEIRQIAIMFRSWMEGQVEHLANIETKLARLIELEERKETQHKETIEHLRGMIAIMDIRLPIPTPRLRSGGKRREKQDANQN